MVAAVKIRAVLEAEHKRGSCGEVLDRVECGLRDAGGRMVYGDEAAVELTESTVLLEMVNPDLAGVHSNRGVTQRLTERSVMTLGRGL